MDEQGNNLVNSIWLMKADKNHKWIVQEIPSGKEIIGVYGNNDSRKSTLIKSLCFILWTPDPNARMCALKNTEKYLKKRNMNKNKSQEYLTEPMISESKWKKLQK